MLIQPAVIPDVKIIRPLVHEDARGYFFEAYHRQGFESAGILADFVQDNESCSGKGILRGLHYQEPPFAQGKLVRVIRGAVLDVAVDLRTASPTYGQHVMIRLSGDNRLMMWIPEGFAHGFLTLEDDTLFHYKCTAYYNRDADRCIRWDDPTLGLPWNYNDPVLSEKDRRGTFFRDLKSPF